MIKSKSGFTLIEALVGFVILGIVSTASWTAINILFRAGQISRNNTIAINLLQKSQEEVRFAAQTLFSTLENCHFPFPNDPDPSTTCDFDDISESFPGFTRTLEVTLQEERTELKRILITINWQEAGMNRQRQSLSFISKPPDPLPGNVYGQIRSSESGSELINGAQITLTFLDGSNVHVTLSSDSLNDKGGNFDFADEDTGQFLLKPGQWLLTATHPSYYNYPSDGETHILTVQSNNEEPPVNVTMVPKPEDATITTRILDETGQPVINFLYGRIYLYENGNLIEQVANLISHTFTIPFETADQRCFTLANFDAFKAGFAGEPGCDYLFEREGVSTAASTSMGGNCTNSWEGDEDSDTICVNPGDSLEVDLSLVPVPEVSINGRVVDSSNNPIAGATIHALWPASDPIEWRKNGAIQTTTTDSNGQFQNFKVPATQGMFPDQAPETTYLQVWAKANVDVFSCCNIIQNEKRESQILYIGPLNPGDPSKTINDLIISTQDTDCGNLTGIITEQSLSGASIADVTISITGTPNETTNGSGTYLYDCSPQDGYRIPSEFYTFKATHPNYYPYISSGNEWYSYAPLVNITPNATTTRNGYLWPLGLSSISGIVFDQSGSEIYPIADAEVVLTLYDGTTRTTMTDTNGNYTFDAVPETWPPPSLPNDSYYRQNPLVHQINVSHNLEIYFPFSQTISTLIANTPLTIDIELDTNNGM